MSSREAYLNESPPLAGDDDIYSDKVPRTIELLISYLEVAGLATPELFGGDPSVQEINDVIDRLRTGHSPDVAAVTRESVRLAAASLAAYIRQLPKPLLVPPHYEALCSVMDAESYGERIASVRDRVAEMPESHQSVLHRLFHFLSKLAGRSTAPGNTAEELVAFWVGMITPMHERGRGMLRNEHRLVGLMVQQHACIFEGSLDAFELPELPLPPHLAATDQRRAKGGWQRIKASLLRDSRGQFKIQVREDECGIYLDVIAPTDVSDDRHKLAERDYLVSLQRHKVEELTLAAVRSMIRDAGSIVEMEVRRYVTEASEAAWAEQLAWAERERREQSQLERYQQSVQQYVEQPHHPAVHQQPQPAHHPSHAQPYAQPHIQAQPQPSHSSHPQPHSQPFHPSHPQPHPHSHHPPTPTPGASQHSPRATVQPGQQPTSVRYAQRQALSLDKLPKAAPARHEPDLWGRHEPAWAPSTASEDLLGLDILSLADPVLPAAPACGMDGAPGAARAGALAAGDTALYRGQPVSILAVHKDDPAGDYYTIRMPNGGTREVEGPLQTVGGGSSAASPRASACLGSDALNGLLCRASPPIAGSSSAGSLPGAASFAPSLTGSCRPLNTQSSLFPASPTDPFAACAMSSAGWMPSPRDSISSCGSASGSTAAASVPPGAMLDAQLFGPNTPVVSAKCPPPPPPPLHEAAPGKPPRPAAPRAAPRAAASSACGAVPAAVGGMRSPVKCSSPPSDSVSDPFGDRNQPSWVPFGAPDPASTAVAPPPFRDKPPPPGAPPEPAPGPEAAAEAARAAAAARAEQEREKARKAEERERRRELDRLEAVARQAQAAASAAEAAKQAEMGELAGLSREEKRARIRTFIEKEQRLKREAADATEAAKREGERLEREEAERRETAERAAREAAEAERLEKVRRKVREKLAAEKKAKAEAEERARKEEEARTEEEARRQAEARARAKREAEVRSAVASAMASDGASALEQALGLAEAEGVEVPELAAARARLKELQDLELKRRAERSRATASLRAAMQADDLELLRRALDSAVAADADAALVSMGEARLIEVEERLAAQERARAEAEARERARTAAVERLNAAVADSEGAGGRGAEAAAAALSALDAAIAEAEAAGVPYHHVWLAKHSRDAVRQEAAAREAAIEAARDALLLAIAACETLRIPALIDAAADAGVPSAELAEARRELEELEREQAERRREEARGELARAVEAGSLEAIEAAAAAAAGAGLDKGELAPARERIEQIREEQAVADRERVAASAELQGLVASKLVDAEAMREGMARAVAAGVDEDVLARGRERQAVLEEEEAQRLEAEELARFEAEEAERREREAVERAEREAREAAEAEERARLAAIEEERAAAAAAAEAARIEEEERLAALEEARIAAEETLRLEAEAADEAIRAAAEEARIEEEERVRLLEEARVEEEMRARIEAEEAEVGSRAAEEEVRRQADVVARAAAARVIQAEAASRMAEEAAAAEARRVEEEEEMAAIAAEIEAEDAAADGMLAAGECSTPPPGEEEEEEEGEDDIAPPSEPYSGDESSRMSDVPDDEGAEMTEDPPSRGDSISSADELESTPAKLVHFGSRSNGVPAADTPALPAFEASFERHFEEQPDGSPDGATGAAACAQCGHAGGAQGAAEAAFAQLQALCEESQASQAAMLVCCEVYRMELSKVEEEAERGSQQGVVNAQNLRIQQLKAQVRQQAAAMRDLAAEMELREAGEDAPAVAERMEQQANQRIERYRTENERLEKELAAVRQTLASSRSRNEVLQQQLADAVHASKRVSLARS
jgi:hypothetical protein